MKVDYTPVTDADLQSTWSGLTGAVDTAFNHPIATPDGRLWLASTTDPTGFAVPPTWVLVTVAVLLVAGWLRWRWWRRRRRARRADGPPALPSDAAVAKQLAKLRKEARKG